ncbi:MAG: hypothetical protein SGJ02_10695, partial [bacterium]|nr:hypothetical protein [bacterium]
MKITFDNSFEALKPRINAPLNGAEQNSNFGSLLKDISPFATQDSKNITNLGPPKRSLDTDVGPMASYKFAPPSMILTESSRITDGQNGVSLEDGSVKSPTLLEAKRVRSKNAYKGLTQEERGEEVK